MSLVAGKDETPISPIGQKEQDFHPINSSELQDGDSHPDTIIMVPLTAVAVD